MPQNAERSQSPRTLQALQFHLGKGSVGRLTVADHFGQAVHVYVLQGEILATAAERDGEEVLERLLNCGAITPSLKERLAHQLVITRRLSDVLFGVVPDELVLDAFAQRFREDLYRFLLGVSQPEFEALETIFVENIQVGHDSRALLDEMVALSGKTRDLYLQAGAIVLAPGVEPPASLDEARLLDLIESHPLLSALFDGSPLERHQVLPLLVGMIARGVARMSVFVPEVPAKPLSTGTRSDAVMARPGEEPPRRPFEPTSVISGRVPVASGFRDPSEELELLSPDLLEPVPDNAEVIESARPLAPPAAAYAEPEVIEPVVDDDDATETDGVEWRQEEDALDAFGHEDPALAMFQDHDARRAGGQFSLSREHLDYIDLDGGVSVPDDLPVDDDEVLEAVDAEGLSEAKGAGRLVSLNFTSPVLTRDEAMRKLEVTNTVLREICYTLDHENGVGSGQAAVQLLLEGAPAAFAGLFYGVEAEREGVFAPDRVLRNLQKRPDTERRSLLNHALKNLIERGLSVTFETVSEERLDAMLERIAGFQQRMGI